MDNRTARRERAVAILSEVDKAADAIVLALKARRDEIHAQVQRRRQQQGTHPPTMAASGGD